MTANPELEQAAPPEVVYTTWLPPKVPTSHFLVSSGPQGRHCLLTAQTYLGAWNPPEHLTQQSSRCGCSCPPSPRPRLWPCPGPLLKHCSPLERPPSISPGLLKPSLRRQDLCAQRQEAGPRAWLCPLPAQGLVQSVFVFPPVRWAESIPGLLAGDGKNAGSFLTVQSPASREQTSGLHLSLEQVLPLLASKSPAASRSQCPNAFKK